MDAMTQIKKSAETNKREDTRVIKAMGFEGDGQVTDAVRQGDIYVTRLTEEQFNNLSLEAWDNGNQLAPGSTQGSRHVAENVNGQFKLFRVTNGDALQGPVVEAKDGLYISHPEHGDIDMKCGGYFRITYQRAHAEELRRVAD